MGDVIPVAKSPAGYTSRLEQIANYILYIAALGPVGLVAWYVIAFSNVAPVGDQWWDDVYIAVKTRVGLLSLEDVFVYNSGHRHVIIKLITGLSTILTDYNVRILRFTAFFTTILNFLLVILLFCNTKCRLIPAFVFLVSTALFTLYHSSSWLDPRFSPNQMALLPVLLGLMVIQRMRPGVLALGLVIISAVASSFTMGFGLAAWVSLPIAAFGIPAYRRLTYLGLWLAAMVLFMAFYTSDYAVGQSGGPSLQLALREGTARAVFYVIEFQAARFDTNDVNAIGTTFTWICTLVLVVNTWQIARTKDEADAAVAALWGSLTIFALVGAALALIGRGPDIPIQARYSPSADGYWVAFIALALVALLRRPPVSLIAVNVGLLIGLMILTIQKNNWSMQHAYRSDCDQCVLDYPLKRLGCFRECFYWGEEQSVYHLAALRLSVFHNETPQSVLPQTAPVITDMPNRWLSVYVRDYMLDGLEQKKIFSIAPVLGEWMLPNEPRSPFYRGEWPIDILPQPLSQTWTSVGAFTTDLPSLIAAQPRVWYLNTPETEAHLAAIEKAFAKLDYSGRSVAITNARFASARFGLRCFERLGTNACDTARVSRKCSAESVCRP